MTANEAIVNFIQTLKLGERITKIVLTCEPGEPVIVEVTRMVLSGDELSVALEKFTLLDKE